MFKGFTVCQTKDLKASFSEDFSQQTCQQSCWCDCQCEYPYGHKEATTH